VETLAVQVEQESILNMALVQAAGEAAVVQVLPV
jgi:hypothetical protein